MSLASLGYFFLYPSLFDNSSLPFRISYLGSLIVWSVSPGGLGACAFLGTRVAIRRAQGATISEAIEDAADITDRNVLKIRILLGCLFASLVGLPFSRLALQQVLDLLYGDSAVDFNKFAFIVVPFMLGFSTNLVLAILDRLIVSIRTFLGLTDGK